MKRYNPQNKRKAEQGHVAPRQSVSEDDDEVGSRSVGSSRSTTATSDGDTSPDEDYNSSFTSATSVSASSVESNCSSADEGVVEIHHALQDSDCIDVERLLVRGSSHEQASRIAGRRVVEEKNPPVEDQVVGQETKLCASALSAPKRRERRSRYGERKQVSIPAARTFLPTRRGSTASKTSSVDVEELLRREGDQKNPAKSSENDEFRSSKPTLTQAHLHHSSRRRQPTVLAAESHTSEDGVASRTASAHRPEKVDRDSFVDEAKLQSDNSSGKQLLVSTFPRTVESKTSGREKILARFQEKKKLDELAGHTLASKTENLAEAGLFLGVYWSPFDPRSILGWSIDTGPYIGLCNENSTSTAARKDRQAPAKNSDTTTTSGIKTNRKPTSAEMKRTNPDSSRVVHQRRYCGASAREADDDTSGGTGGIIFNRGIAVGSSLGSLWFGEGYAEIELFGDTSETRSNDISFAPIVFGVSAGVDEFGPYVGTYTASAAVGAGSVLSGFGMWATSGKAEGIGVPSTNNGVEQEDVTKSNETQWVRTVRPMNHNKYNDKNKIAKR